MKVEIHRIKIFSFTYTYYITDINIIEPWPVTYDK